MADKNDEKTTPAVKSTAAEAKRSETPETSGTPTIDAVAESNDPSVNPQSQRPGHVQPERTPGSAPSVVPLPAGAAPDAKDVNPLPEDAIDGYPPATKMQAEADAVDAAGKNVEGAK